MRGHVREASVGVEEDGGVVDDRVVAQPYYLQQFPKR